MLTATGSELDLEEADAEARARARARRAASMEPPAASQTASMSSLEYGISMRRIS